MSSFQFLDSASAIAAALRQKQFSAFDLLEATLDRVATLNPTLNAIVTIDAAAARAAAADSDERLRDGTARPLEGLPISIKDAFDVSGMVSTAGATMFRDRVPTADAMAVQALRAAGAVIFGKSNVPMLSGDFQTTNPIFGTTNNPWNVSRSPGGSSGGAAAAVSTGMSAFELGSDLGGSIRWPSHCCGLFGLKPTWGLIQSFGHVPPMPEMRLKHQTDLMVAGPIARSANDLELLLPILAGAGREAPVTPRAARIDTPNGLRVALWLNEQQAPVDADVRAGVQHAASALRAAGATVDETARPDFSFEEAFEVFSMIHHALFAAGLPQKVRDKLAAMAAGFSPDDHSHRAMQARAAKLDAATYGRLQDRRLALKRAWAAFFGRYDVVLCPPAPVVALPHDHGPDIHARELIVDGVAKPYFDLLHWASLATASHLPAVVAPVMRTTQDLPTGVQIIAAEHEDMTAIAVAKMLETELGGFVAPPMAA